MIGTELEVNYKSILFFIILLKKLLFQEHEKICPNRTLMDEYLYSSEDQARPNIPLTTEPTIVNTEVSWDQVCI